MQTIVNSKLLVEPSDTALLVLDMQNGFCHPNGTIGKSKDISLMRATIPNIKRIVAECRSVGIPDIWTIQEHHLSDRTRLNRKIPAHTQRSQHGPAAVARTWDAEIIEELQPLISDNVEVVRKHRFSAFFDTRLDTLLRMFGTRTLIVCGVTTTLCVESTVRDAYQRDYNVIVVEDAVGMSSRELHESSIRVMKTYFGVGVTTDQVSQIIRATT